MANKNKFVKMQKDRAGNEFTYLNIDEIALASYKKLPKDELIISMTSGERVAFTNKEQVETIVKQLEDDLIMDKKKVIWIISKLKYQVGDSNPSPATKISYKISWKIKLIIVYYNCNRNITKNLHYVVR